MSRDDYQLLDSGSGEKLERFGRFVLSRPCAQAVWRPQNPALWHKVDAHFVRAEEGNTWTGSLPQSWWVGCNDLQFKISGTDFGHLGLFPEHRTLWSWMEKSFASAKNPSFLNLFAYSGAASLVAARAGAEVCHVDSSKGMVAWARENAERNGLTSAPIRWIVDDVIKFLQREGRRGRRYDAILLDPPSFGRGAQGEIFKIEEHLPAILQACKALLSDNPLFLILSCHTPGYTPTTLHHLLTQDLSGQVESGELFLQGPPDTFAVPSGCFARWTPKART